MNIISAKLGSEKAVLFLAKILSLKNVKIVAVSRETYEKALETIGDYLGIVISFSLAETLMRSVEGLIWGVLSTKAVGSGLELWTLAQTKPITSFIRSMYFNLGFGWLTWSIFGDVIRVVISEPTFKPYS